MGEIKQTNFRISTDAADAFRGFCEEQGINQAQGFDYLLEVLALDKAKSSIQSRETEILNFEQHAKALLSAYLHSLELNENAEARIREQFATQLESQSQTIADYQNRIKELKEQLEEAVTLAETYQAEFKTAQSALEVIEKKQSQTEADLSSVKAEKEIQLTDKNSIISMLTSKLAEAEKKAREYDALKKHTSHLQADLSSALQTIKDNEKDAQIDKERAVRAAERTLEAEHRRELERLRSQNTELLQTVAATEKAASEELRKVEKENAVLREELATIKGKIQ